MIVAVRNILVAASGVSSLVSTRVYPGILPQNVTFPAIVLNVVSELDPITHDKASGLVDGVVQVDCYADDYADAEALHLVVKAALLGYSVGNVQGIFLVRSRDLYDNDGSVYRRSADYNVWSK
jgi:hypothetical protein